MDNLFPLTSVTYTISYAYQLANTFLPYIFGAFLPCDRIFACSAAAKTTVHSYFRQALAFLEAHGSATSGSFPGEVLVVPLGVDLADLLARKQPQDTARAALGIDPDVLVLLYFGRVSSSTKCDLLPLITLLRTIPATIGGRPVHLLIAGSGDDATGDGPLCKRHQLLETYASHPGVSQRIRLVHRPSDAVRALMYSAADVFLSPSDNIQESYGLTVVEAQAMGLPVVVSDWDGYRDIVRDGETGFLVPSYWCKDPYLNYLAQVRAVGVYHFRQAQSVAVDLDRMSECVVTLLQDKELRKRMSLQAARHAEQYDWKAVIGFYERIWRELFEQSVSYGPQQKGVADKTRTPGLREICGRLTPEYHAAFAHYATRVVNDSWQVSKGRAGDLLLAGATRNLSRRLLLRILKCLEFRWQSATWVTIREVTDAVDFHERDREYGYARDEVLRHVMWLLKQGVLRCIPGAGGAPTVARSEPAANLEPLHQTPRSA